MRKITGLLMVALLLLPAARANAWTLTIKVAGASVNDYVSTAFKLTNGTTSARDFKGNGTTLIYPISQVTLSRTGAATPAMILDGVTAVSAGLQSWTPGNHTLSVSYSSTVSYADLTLAQSEGGLIYAENRNSTWTSTGVKGLPTPSSLVTVAIAADWNHKVSGYHVGVSPDWTTTSIGSGATGEVVILSLPAANQTITPIFSLAARTTATLFSPIDGFTGTVINCIATATSNDTGLSYAFTVTGPGVSSPVTVGNAFSFLPSAVGTYLVTATVTSAHDSTGVTASVSINVTDGQVNKNQGCTSCHSTQSATIVNNYRASVHNLSSASTCTGCHTADIPHEAGINTINIDQGFKVVNSAIKGVNLVQGDIFCTLCHKTQTAAYLASGHGGNPIGPSCGGCHTAGGSGDAHAIQEANYAVVGANCLRCHNGNTGKDFAGINHFAATPDAGFGNISAAAYVGYQGEGINVCSKCHFSFDGHGTGANSTASFAANAAILADWAASGHGDRRSAAWTPGNTSAGPDWRRSGDAKDFQAAIPASDCVRCHTADGFAQFFASGFSDVNSVGAGDGNRWNAPLSCSACHASDASGSATAARRSAARTPGRVGVASFYNLSTLDLTSGASVKSRIAANFPDTGESNLCNSCHSGRAAGPNLTALFATGNWDLSNAPFQESHYMAAAGTMYMKAGFKNFTTLTAPAATGFEGGSFASDKTYGQTLSALDATSPEGMAGGEDSSHRRLGTALIAGTESYLPAGGSALTSNGPCVTCHLKAYDPIPGNGFTPAASGRSGAGHSLQVDEATARQLCLECHADAPHLDGGDGAGHARYTTMSSLADLKTALMGPQSAAFQNGLTLVRQLLSIKYQIGFDPARYPYFYDLQKDPAGRTAVTDWTRAAVSGVSDAAVAALGNGGVTVIPAGGLTRVQAYRLMGACFNLNLLARDPGAYLHARSYAQRLVYDTVDYLDDNAMDFTTLATARALTAAGLTGLAGVYSGTNVNVFASDGTLASESMAWLAGTHYSDGSNGNAHLPLKLRP
jgi:hypothetical protein